MNEKRNSNNNINNNKKRKLENTLKKNSTKEEKCGDFLINNESLLRMPHNIKHRIY